jgi:hypothetical protein
LAQGRTAVTAEEFSQVGEFEDSGAAVLHGFIVHRVI